MPAISALSLIAPQPAGAKGVKKPAAAYCVPSSTAGAAATENANNTKAVLSSYTEGSLAKAGAIGVPVGASSAGTISIVLTSGTTTIGSGNASVSKSGCFQLTVVLTSKGKQLLKRDEAAEKPISILISSTFKPAKGKAATAKATATVKP
jgi:hypothetical protein